MVTYWERDLIEQGIKCGKDGNLDHAVASFTRAGTNSKEPHLSKIFLGSLYYQSNKNLAAISSFSEAIRLIQGIKSSSLYNKYDEFVARFNRAMVYFRAGNDDLGLKDFEKALRLDSNNIKALEIYAIVLRRLGKYYEAMETKNRILEIQT